MNQKRKHILLLFIFLLAAIPVVFAKRTDTTYPVKHSGVNYIRLNFSGGGTYYSAVKSIHNKRLVLKEDPGFILDENGRARFYTFPKNDWEEEGVRYTLFVPQK